MSQRFPSPSVMSHVIKRIESTDDMMVDSG